MNNLRLYYQRLLTFIRTHRGLFIVILLTILVIIGILVRLFTPLSPIPITTNETALPQLNNERYTLKSSRYSGLSISVPPRLSYYQVTTTNPTEITSSIVTSFNLIPHSEVPNFWLSTDKTVVLTVNDQGLITFSTNTPVETLPSNYSAEQAIETARSQFASFGLDQSIFSLDTTKYLSGEGEELVTVANPTMVELRFTPKIDTYPLIYGSQTESFYIFYLNKDYLINKAIFAPLAFKTTRESQADTLSLDEAIEQINEGNLTVLNVYSDITSPGIDPNLDRINFTEVTLEYRLNPVTNMIIPYYHFIGVEDADTGRQNVEIITPAIITQ